MRNFLLRLHGKKWTKRRWRLETDVRFERQRPEISPAHSLLSANCLTACNNLETKMVLVGGGVARQLAMGLGVVYPLYMSTEALHSGKKRELQQWITYWAVSALLMAVETVGDAVLGSWMPFYYELKLAMLAWLVLPQYRGALIVHEKWLSPFFREHEQVIDATLSDVKRRASEKIVQMCKETAAGALRRSSGAVAQSQQYVASQIVQQAISASLGPLPSSTVTRSPEVPGSALPGLLSLFSSTAGAKTDDSKTDKVGDIDGAEKSSKEVPAKLQGEAKTQSPSKKRRDKAQAKGSEAKEPKKGQKATTEATSPSGSAPQSAKTRQLVERFKKMLLKGFQLQYFASKGVKKQRVLRLDDADSRYITFISARDAEATPGEAAGSPNAKKKSARLMLVNITRVSGTIDQDGNVPTDLIAEMELTKAFSIENGKGGPMVFQAESQKNRDLLVAGLRLLIAEHKQQQQKLRSEEKTSGATESDLLDVE